MSNVEKIISKQRQDIECTSCGAVFNIHMPSCPFCGSVNELGSEEQYLHYLETIRKNLDEAGNIPEQAYMKEAKSGLKKAAIVMAILLAIVVLLFLGGVVITVVLNNYFANQDLKQAQWEQENYPLLDEMYEAGDYDGLVEFWHGLIDKNGHMDYSIWSWEHYEFLVAHSHYIAIKDYWAEIKDGQGEKFDYRYKYGFSNAMTLLCDTWDIKLSTVKNINENEYEIILGYQDYARGFLRDVFGLSDPEIDDIKTKVMADYPSVGYDYNKIDEVYKSLQ